MHFRTKVTDPQKTTGFENLTLLIIVNLSISLLRIAARSSGVTFKSSSVTPFFELCFKKLPFWQPMHLHLDEHSKPYWKHSQYFFRQFEFLQLQPRETSINTSPPPFASKPSSPILPFVGLYFGSKASGSFCFMSVITLLRVGLSVLLRQHSQLQFRQKVWFLKHSQ